MKIISDFSYFKKAVVLVAILASPILFASMTVETGIDRPGQDYSSFNLTADGTAGDCMQICLSDPRCKAYTYVIPGCQGHSPRCWLKSAIPAPKAYYCYVSGYKY